MAAATVTSPSARPSRALVETGVLSGLIVAGTVAGVAYLANRRSLPGLQVETAALPPAASGFPYSTALVASGGVPPYSWALTQGALPLGLQLGLGGSIVGIPSALGAFTFSATVSDSSHTPLTAEESFTLLVAQGETVSTTVLPPASVGQPYSATLTAAGGTPPYSWQASAGALPAGLALSAQGELSGTPAQAGNFGFAVQATDSGAPPEVRQGTVVLVVVSPAPVGPPTPVPPVQPGGVAIPGAILVQPTAVAPAGVTVQPASRTVAVPPATPAVAPSSAAQVTVSPAYQQAHPGIQSYPPQARAITPQVAAARPAPARPAAAVKPLTGTQGHPGVRRAVGGGGGLLLISDGGNRWGLLDSGGTLHPIRNPRLAQLQGYDLTGARRYSPRAFAALPVGRPLV